MARDEVTALEGHGCHQPMTENDDEDGHHTTRIRSTTRFLSAGVESAIRRTVSRYLMFGFSHPEQRSGRENSRRCDLGIHDHGMVIGACDRLDPHTGGADPDSEHVIDP